MSEAVELELSPSLFMFKFSAHLLNFETLDLHLDWELRETASL